MNPQDPIVSLPELLRESLAACGRVLRAQERAFVATVFVLILLERAAVAVSPSIGVLGLFALVPFALLAHAQALGVDPRNSRIFGRRGRVIFGYCLDAGVLGFLMLAASVTVLMALRPPATPAGVIETLLVMGIVGPLAAARVCLRLAARALRDQRSWSAHFALTRGHALHLAGGLWAILVPFVLAAMSVSVLLGDFWILKSIVMNALSVLAVLALACYTSLGYRALVRGDTGQLAALPAPAP